MCCADAPMFEEMSPEEIDLMVTRAMSLQVPTLVEIEPFHSAVLNVFDAHGGEWACLKLYLIAWT